MKSAAPVNYASFCLRFGLAFVFTFAAVSEYLDPQSYIHFLPTFIQAIMDPELELHIFGVYEILLSIWILSGKWLTASSFLATVTIFALTVFNLESFGTLFRNIAIVFGGVALLFLSMNPTSTSVPTRKKAKK